MQMNVIPTRLALEVVRDGGGRWDTRTVDLELGRCGAHIESGVIADLRRLAERNLIQEDNTDPRNVIDLGKRRSPGR
ncbi:hypothetical protein [Micromonospora sp. IBSANI012]|uniref:hypothetical protein n=1 Tax=Micromonospora sp. IBSANI012 TaxID=3457761 RepID=UPI00405A3A51